MEAGVVQPWLWNDGGQAGGEVQRFEDHVRDTVTVRSLQAVTHIDPACQRQAFVGDGRPGDMQAQPLEHGSLMRAKATP